MSGLSVTVKGDAVVYSRTFSFKQSARLLHAIQRNRTTTTPFFRSHIPTGWEFNAGSASNPNIDHVSTPMVHEGKARSQERANTISIVTMLRGMRRVILIDDFKTVLCRWFEKGK